MAADGAPARHRPAIPRGVWILGFVSMLMDVSSEMIHALLPLYLTLTLGASALVVGAIEGFAEATALIVKVFSGSLSDRWRKRQPITAFGYGLAALSKPLFALATSPFLVLVARFLDRIGKGIRGAPRDALIAALAPSAIRGAAFGLRQSLDTVGAFAGPLLAMALMLAWNDDFRAVFWVAVVPAILSLLLVLFAVRDPEVAPSGDAIARERPRLDLRTLRSLGRLFWAVTIAGGALTLARFSEAFLILRASDVGLAAAYAPLVLVGMNIVYSVTAFPAGLLADRVAPRTLLLIGIALLVAGDIALASTRSLAGLAAGVLLWGLHMGFTQGILAAMVAQAAPARLHGTAFGAFNFASGIALLAASVIAGALWQLFGPAATFWAGAALAGISALLAWYTLDSRRSP
jgi:MFS family permease